MSAKQIELLQGLLSSNKDSQTDEFHLYAEKSLLVYTPIPAVMRTQDWGQTFQRVGKT